MLTNIREAAQVLDDVMVADGEPIPSDVTAVLHDVRCLLNSLTEEVSHA